MSGEAKVGVSSLMEETTNKKEKEKKKKYVREVNVLCSRLLPLKDTARTRLAAWFLIRRARVSSS